MFNLNVNILVLIKLMIFRFNFSFDTNNYVNQNKIHFLKSTINCIFFVQQKGINQYLTQYSQNGLMLLR